MSEPPVSFIEQTLDKAGIKIDRETLKISATQVDSQAIIWDDLIASLITE